MLHITVWIFQKIKMYLEKVCLQVDAAMFLPIFFKKILFPTIPESMDQNGSYHYAVLV